MDAPQITDALDRLQTLFTPADDAMVDLSNLVGGYDGPLFNAINALRQQLADSDAALRDKLTGLLRHASSVLGIQGWDALTHEIDTAISELTQ